MSTDDDLVAVVTGGGRGIGAATAIELGRRGYRTVVNYRRDAGAALRTVRQIEACGGRAMAAAADVTDETSARGLMGATMDAYGRLDVLVCNANVGLGFGAVESVGWEPFAAKILDELAAAFHPTVAALPIMKDQRSGRIVYVSSEAAKGPVAVGMGGHSTAKAALNAFGRIVAAEAGRYGVLANVVSCGFVRTEANAQLNEDRLRGIVARTPLRPACRASRCGEGRRLHGL